MNERVNNLVRINKTDAEILYYNGMGVILNAKNINPFHPMGNTSVLRYNEQGEVFKIILNHFTFHNGEAWYWTDKHNKEILDNRKKEYKKLKSYRQMCNLYNIEVDKPINQSEWKELLRNPAYRCIDIIYDYIIKYKPIDIDSFTVKSEYDNLYKFLKSFDIEKCMSRDIFQEIMKKAGFK